MVKFSYRFILTAALIFAVGFLSVGNVFAEEIPNFGVPEISGVISSTSTHFEITDSSYLNIVLDSIEPVKLQLESVPEMVTIITEPSASIVSTQFTITGFLPDTTYYKYEDNYHNLTEFTTDASGSYFYTQDLSAAHIIFIQPRHSTKFIEDDATGGDCVLIGIWNATTKTCTLTTDINETIQIDNDGITLDGAGHSSIGGNTGSGVYLSWYDNVTVKNFNISHYAYGIILANSSNNSIFDNTFSYNESGLYLNNSTANRILTNIVTFNTLGMEITNSNGNNLFSNNLSSNTKRGIDLSSSDYNTLLDNTVSDSYFGIIMADSGESTLSGNIMFDNKINFTLADSYNQNIDITNLTDGKPIYYVKNAINQTFDATTNAGTFYCIMCNNVIIKDLTLSNNWTGVTLYGTQDSTVENITGSGAIRFGVSLLSSSGNTVRDNNFIGGADSSNSFWLYLASSDNNFILQNSVSAGNTGLTLDAGSSYNEIADNIIKDNGQVGIYLLYGAYNNKIVKNNISHNLIGALSVDSGGIGNEVYNNNFIENTYQIYYWYGQALFNKPVPIGGNYYSNYDTSAEDCVDSDFNSICDSPYVFTGGQDNLPWVAKDGWKLNQPPVISNIQQLKSDKKTNIIEGENTTESSANNPSKSIVVFKANVNDSDNNQIKLQIELKEFDQVFDGNNLLESGFSISGSEIVLTKDLLLEGKYKWRARIADNTGLMSDWVEFGTLDDFDFEVKLVPLYTQVMSIYPNRSPQDEWAEQTYAEGRGNLGPEEERCGLTIKECGCAITSAVMILRYFNIKSAVNSEDVNPLNLNNWLNENNGYIAYGDLDWPKISEYSKILPLGSARLRYDGRKDFKDSVTLNDYLKIDNPVIIKNSQLGHFLIVDGKLDGTYTVKDPFWYNTRKLDEIATDNSVNIRDYNNYFDGLRLYSAALVGIDGISFNLASPAELLITDPLGRRLGKDPIANVEYNEIPESSYGQEGISNAGSEVLVLAHQIKNIWIPEPISGDYAVQVIGTGDGNYTLQSLVYDADSQPHSQIIEGNIRQDFIVDYLLKFTPNEPQNIVVELQDKEPPIISHTSVATQYVLNSSPMIFDFSSQDSGTGISSVDAMVDGLKIVRGNYIFFDNVGSHALTITASDFAGNITTETVKFNVVYNFSGFLAPIKPDGAGVYKQGRTLPVKFNLFDDNGQFISSAIAQLFVSKIENNVVGTDEIPLSVSAADTGNLFRYDATNNQYIYNLSTNSLSIGTWQIKVILNDGRSYIVSISIH